MRAFLLALVFIGLFSATTFRPAAACEWIPSSDCPATPRGYASYPCSAGQLKADWNTMLYYQPGQTYYAVTGLEINADIWCVDTAEAHRRGFRRAPY